MRTLQCCGGVNGRNSPVEIIEEGKHEEGHLAPCLFLTELQRIIVHDTCWVIKQLLGVCGTVEVPGNHREEHNTAWVAGSAFRLLLGNAHITILDTRFPSAGCANCNEGLNLPESPLVLLSCSQSKVNVTQHLCEKPV